MQNPKPNLKKEHLYNKLTCLVAQRVSSLPVIPDTWDRSLVWEYPLEKGMATHSSINDSLGNSTACIVLGVIQSWT